MVALGSCEKDESSDVWTVGSWVDNRSCSMAAHPIPMFEWFHVHFGEATVFGVMRKEWQ